MKLGALLAGAVMAAGALVAGPAHAQKSADTLRVNWLDPVVDIDPYYNSQRTGLILAHQAWDGLIFRDPEGFAMKPLLAESWKWVDDTTLEFKLRHGVTFHNGDPFSAADVVYTIKTVTDPASGVAVPSNYTWIAGAEAIDDYTVRIKLKQAFPAALEFVSFVTPIYPKAYREKVGRDGYRKEPVGAGPYRITHWDIGADVNMERFEGYYDGGGKGRPAIKKLVFKQSTDQNVVVNSLLGGQSDWIWDFQPDFVPKIAAMPNLDASRLETFRILHFTLNAAGRDDPKSPLKDVRVRKALFYAIDRQTFAKQLVQGGARVPDATCYFTQFGCDQSAAVHYDYDPAKAKALLAEAGYPNGFDIEIVNPGILTSWMGSIQAYLQAIGVRAHVTSQVSAAVQLRIEKGDVPMYVSSWGSYSINDASAFMPFFFSSNSDDLAQDPELTAALKQGGSVVDPEIRKAAYAKAIHIISDRAYMLPVSTFVRVYGTSRNLDFKPYPDEMPRFFWSKWK
jgi:peptide/nickel transport system substrate-binding protein